ncbi:MAG: hypothetical protein ABIP95_08865 [Pelobium sp.]
MREKFKLIEGIFSAKDAREILLTLIEEKIKFHELKSFSDEVKTGAKNNQSLLKIEELKNTRVNILSFLVKDEHKNESFHLTSSIEIEKVI